jgi:hypothetical protein
MWAIVRPSPRQNATSTSGSLATLVPRTIFPVASTKQMLLRSSDTSIPHGGPWLSLDDAWGSRSTAGRSRLALRASRMAAASKARPACRSCAAPRGAALLAGPARLLEQGWGGEIADGWCLTRVVCSGNH